MLIYSAFILLLIWMIVLSFVLYRSMKHYARLVSGTKRRHLDEILDTILKEQKVSKSMIDELRKKLDKQVDASRFHYQKVGFVRFNSFERSAGEQSFVVALLDGENNGILLNFLYTRDGVRTYAKKLRGGKSEDYELSQEEQEAVKKAL